MSQLTSQVITGTAAGVPFVAAPPARGSRTGAPVVLAWHLLDPPRTEAAFAAAVPLEGLEAWRIYLGLPLSGSRIPSGGWEELMRLGYEDAVLKLDRPVVFGAFEELGPAFAELHHRFGFDARSVGVMGGSIGAAVAELVMAEGELDVSAAVLVSPVIQLRRAVEALARQFGVTYEWSEESETVADRLDFVGRAGELAGRGSPAVLAVVGEQDHAAFKESAAQLVEALWQRYGRDDRSRLATVPDMAHALAEEPGIEPAPQTPHAAAVDRLAVEWFEEHLTERP